MKRICERGQQKADRQADDPCLHVHPDFQISPAPLVTEVHTRARWEEDMLIWDTEPKDQGGMQRARVAESLGLTFSAINVRLTALRTLANKVALNNISLSDARTSNIWRMFKRRLQSNSMKITPVPVQSLSKVLQTDPLQLKETLTQIRDLKHYLHFAGIHRDRSSTQKAGTSSKTTTNTKSNGEAAAETNQAQPPAHSLSLAATTSHTFNPQDDVEIWRAYMQYHPSKRSTDTNLLLHMRLVELSEQFGRSLAQVRDHLHELIHLHLGLTAQPHSAGRPFTSAEDTTILEVLGHEASTFAPSFTQVFPVSQKLRCTMGVVAARYKQLQTLRLLESVGSG